MFNQFKLSFKHWQSWLLPLALAATTALQTWYVSLYYQWQPILVVIAGVIGLALLFIARTKTWRKSALGVAIAADLSRTGFLVVDTDTCRLVIGHSNRWPYLLTSGGNSGGIGSGSVNSGLLKYVEAHQGNAKYLFATSNASTAAPYIIKSGKAVMAIGGFNGTDPAITLKQFKALVKSGDMKYYLSSGRAGNSKIEAWVEKVGKKVAASKYGSKTTTNAQNNHGGRMAMGGMGSGTLYELDASMVK